jgi:hypothetical protein
MYERYDPPKGINEDALKMLTEAGYFYDRKTISFHKEGCGKTGIDDPIPLGDLTTNCLVPTEHTKNPTQKQIESGFEWLKKRLGRK